MLRLLSRVNGVFKEHERRLQQILHPIIPRPIQLIRRDDDVS